MRIHKIQAQSVDTPDLGLDVRDAAILFDVAVDPDNGNLYVVWQDARFTGFDQIAYSQSTDDGFTWSEPVRINQTPAQVTAASVCRVPSTGTTLNDKPSVTTRSSTGSSCRR